MTVAPMTEQKNKGWSWGDYIALIIFIIIVALIMPYLPEILESFGD